MVGEFKLMDKELQSLKMKIKTFDKQRQLSVHLEGGVHNVYSMLHSLNPIEEIRKASELINFLPKILNFLTKCIPVIELKFQIDREKRMAPIYERIENLLKKAPNTPQKDDIIKMMEKIKNGVFFDEIVKKNRK